MEMSENFSCLCCYSQEIFSSTVTQQQLCRETKSPSILFTVNAVIYSLGSVIFTFFFFFFSLVKIHLMNYTHLLATGLWRRCRGQG